MMTTLTSKIRADHLERRAYVYVRQSTQFQVVHHRESTERQYNLRQRAAELGWAQNTIETIDEDQGQSAASAEHRTGFQRLVSEIGLGRVGVVLMLEVSRLARSCSDWHRLVEICSVTRTLIADEAGVYDPRDPNDRLLLGVKGTLSEAELFTLRTRLYEGRWNKARRGELGRSIPTGYVVDPATRGWVKDPDRQVQERLSYVFVLFRRLRVARSVVVALKQEKLSLPVRVWGGPRNGQLDWKEPTFGTVMRILRNPAYAGTYVYGQWDYDGTRPYAKTGKARPRTRAPQDWPVCILEHHAGYISWDEYVANLDCLHHNWFRSMTRGAPREGCALLQGIAWCGRCGAKLSVHTFSARDNRKPAYMCSHDYQHGAAHTCQNMASKPIDDAVIELFLEAVAPAQLEVATKVVGQLRQEKLALQRQWEQQLAQARYEAQLAQRQYDAVDPDNRLVASELERRWNEKLESLQKLEQSFAQVQQEAHFSVTPREEQAIQALARDLPAVWNAKTTTDLERKQLLRYAISEVQLDGVSEPGKIEIRVTWRSGATTVRKIDRIPVGSWAPRTSDAVVSRIRQLAPHLPVADIIDCLKREGLRSAHGKVLRERHVRYIARCHGITVSTSPELAVRKPSGENQKGSRLLN
jgi:DNA invertase Pin-like site-specific DNA recombinase